MTIDYDNLWESKWRDIQRWGPTQRHEMRLINRLLDLADFNSIAEVGCGKGEKLKKIVSKFSIREFAGVDISDKALLAAKRDLPLGSFHNIDIEKTSLKEKYDLVLCTNVVEHLSDDSAALANIRKMTNKWAIISSIQGTMRPYEATIGHLRNYKKGELREKCERAGFSVKKEINWGFPFYSPVYRTILNWGDTNNMSAGEYGPMKIALCQALYALFSLNSSTSGDIVMILGEAV